MIYVYDDYTHTRTYTIRIPLHGNAIIEKYLTNVCVIQVCKEEEEAIRVDLHEGCGRTKLFWLLALADKATLQALVEFRDMSSDLSAPVARANVLQLARVGVCRYCGMVSNDGLLAIGNVCANDECQV